MENEAILKDSESSSDETESRGSENEDCNLYIHTKGEFFGCYLLVSKNPKFKGRTYIGFTVDPNRRLKQHNGGHQMGGAKRTSGRGPWEMVLIIHGFPSDISALRFEWAWQHPTKSRRLGRGVIKKRSKENPLAYRFRVVTEMLSVGPWNRLPLTIRWLKQEYELPFPLSKQPPVHMPIAYGLVDISKPGRGQGCSASSSTSNLKSNDESREKRAKPSELCELCKTASNGCPSEHLLTCYHTNCCLRAHTTCLAARLCPAGEGHLLPICGPCPQCHQPLLWGELIRQLRASLSQTSKRIESVKQVSLTQPPPAKRRKAKPHSEQGEHWTQLLHV